MPLDDGESLRILQQLDEGTEWELPREMCADGNGDPSMADVSGDLEPPETVSNILDCVDGMNERGEIEDIIVVLNMKGDDQLLFTTMERNDLIIGAMEIAKMNWHTTQIDLQIGNDE